MQKGKDGRQAFLNLYKHYLGQNNIDNMASSAKQKIQNLAYTGETRRFNFKKYVTAHVNQHIILTDLIEHRYAGIDEQSKVRHLLNGIKTKDLDPVKTRILSDTTLCNDFDACMSLFKDFIKQARTQGAQVLNISALKSGDKLHPKTVRFQLRVEDRYYSNREYRKMTNN